MGSQSAFALYNVARNTANGLDISFYESMWAYPGGGGQPGDGFSVFLKDGNDNISSPGYLGGALGYSAYSTSNSASPGISNALFGVGFDTYGNFTSNSYGGQDCINNAGGTTSGQYQYTSAITRSGVTTYETETYYASPNTNDNGISGGNAILIRGPQGSSQSAGYCVITPHPENPDTATIGSNTFTTRALGTHLMRITVEPSTLANPQIRVYVDGVQKTTAPAPLAYKDSPTFKFGFSGGTGRVTQNVDIWSLNINTFDGLSPPDPPSNISVTAVPNTNGGSETVTWAAPGSWGSSETGTGYRSYTAKVYDVYGTIYQGYSCTTLSTTCVISGVPAGNYTVAVTATNKANITSINSTITSAAQFLVSSLTNFTNGPCLSQATSNQFIDTFTVANYCVLRFLTPNSTNWYAPTGVNSLNYLIVGGGGAGGANRGGGGGGGGVETGTMVVSTPVHTIVVGSGGVGTSTEPTPSSSNGGSSSIDNETVLGGGAGGSGNANGLSGSSGGGGGSGVVLLQYSIPYGSGETTSTFTTWALTTANSGYLFRCMITDKDAIGLVATDSTTAATLTVNPAIAGSIESTTVYTTFGTANIFDTATAQYGTGALTFTLVTTPSSNGHIHFDTNTASVLIDTNTLVGTYYETLTVTDIKGATAIFYETTTVSRGVRTGFVIGGSPKANLTGILTETNTLYLSNATPIAPYYAMYDTVVATYSLVSGPSGSTCSATSSGQVYASGLSLTTCYVTVNVAQSANYLAARDTATIVFNPLISLYAVQYNAGAHQFQLANAQTPVTKQDTSTASDSSTTNTAPKISGFTVSGNDTSGVTITVYGKGFWSPLSYDTAQIDGRPLYSYFPVTISSVTTSVTPQVMVLTLPAGWCATNSVPFGTDVGPITIETPAGWAMSIADYFSQ